MKTVHFELAGQKQKSYSVFLQSRHRKYNKKSGIYHNNQFHTIVSMPLDYYNENFKFERVSGIYRTSLNWGVIFENGFAQTYKLPDFSPVEN